MVPMGSVSDTYRPMQLSKSGEETPKTCRADAESSPLWGIPSPLYNGSWGWAWATARPSPQGCLYKYMCKREETCPHPKNASFGEENWGEPRRSLVESPLCSGKPLAQGVIFQLGGPFFRGEDFASHPWAESSRGAVAQDCPAGSLQPKSPHSVDFRSASPEGNTPPQEAVCFPFDRPSLAVPQPFRGRSRAGNVPPGGRKRVLRA